MPISKADLDEFEIFLISMLDKVRATKRHANAIFFSIDERSFPDESVDLLAGDAARIVSGAADDLTRAIVSLEHAIRLLDKRRKSQP